jgi:hypothetical protein
MRKTCKVTLTLTKKIETILEDIDSDNYNEIIETIQFGLASMDEVGKVINQYFTVDKVEEV